LTAFRELVLPLELLAIPLSVLVNFVVNLLAKYRGDPRAQVSAPRLLVLDFQRAILVFACLSAAAGAIVLMWLTVVAVDSPAALIAVLLLGPAAWLLLRGIPLMILYRVIERVSASRSAVPSAAGDVASAPADAGGLAVRAAKVADLTTGAGGGEDVSLGLRREPGGAGPVTEPAL
jgi:hypothetical protein